MLICHIHLKLTRSYLYSYTSLIKRKLLANNIFFKYLFIQFGLILLKNYDKCLINKINVPENTLSFFFMFSRLSNREVYNNI